MTKRTLCVPGSVTAVLAIGALLASATHSGFVYANPRSNDALIQGHRDRQAQLMDSSRDILARAEQETRDLTESELSEIEGLNREFEDIDRQINLRERTLQNAGSLNQPRGRQTDPDPDEDLAPSARPTAQATPAATGRRAEPQPRATARGQGGFRHFGEFAAAVQASSRRGVDIDARLRNAAASTYGQEATGADGGFAVPPDFRSEIMSRVYGEDSLITRTDRQTSSSNTMTLPVDNTTPWQTSGGIQAYWAGEAAAMSQSKPALENATIKLEKLTALVPITEELLEDAPAMDGYLRKKAPEKIDFKLSYGIAWGNGVGMPLGFMNSPALVTVAAEAAQTADTINATNISKMWARMPVNSRRTAVWLIHPDAEPQLDLITVGQTPVYMPAGGLADAPYGRLKGRPVIPHQVCETVGDLGDIMLVDLNEYLTATKIGGGRDANGLKVDTSMHLWFDQDILAFKFTLRVAGQPWWASAIAQRDGSNTQSPFVTLASR
jgi:HK97 family phage major capsid protein